MGWRGAAISLKRQHTHPHTTSLTDGDRHTLTMIMRFHCAARTHQALDHASCSLAPPFDAEIVIVTDGTLGQRWLTLLPEQRPGKKQCVLVAGTTSSYNARSSGRSTPTSASSDCAACMQFNAIPSD